MTMQFERIRQRLVGATFALCAASLTWAITADAQTRDVSVQVGVPAPNIVALQLYVAEQVGFFDEEDLAVEVHYASGAPQALQVVAAGQADVALGTIEPLISAHDKGLNAKAFARLNRHNIYYLAVPADSEIQSVEDLQGAKVGVANLGGAAVSLTRATLRSAGVEVTPDTLVPVGIGEQAITALNGGHVQALGLWSNAYYAMERNGHSFRYFRHPTLADFGNIALMTSDSTLEARRDELCGFSRAVAKASAFMVENPEAALRIYWQAVPSARKGDDEAEAIENGMIELKPQIADFNIGFPPQAQYGVFDEATVARYEELLKEQGLTETTPPVDEVVTDALVECMNDFDYEAVRERARSADLN